jgi:hypothetical protein
MTDIKNLEMFDWFAGQALAGILANSHYPPQGSGEPLDQYVARVTDTAYRLAEAMIKQGRRLKKEATGAW